MKMKYAIRIVAFILIFGLIFGAISKIVTVPSDYRNYQWVAGFYEEEKDSLDAVYVGSSNCYSFWNPMTAWNEYGIAVWPYATNGMLFEATEYIIKEAQKKQPDAVYIVNINTICDPDRNLSRIHWNVDYMPFSFNKMALVHRLSDVCGLSLSESMECYIPMIRYHSRWNALEKQDFTYEVDGMKGAASYGTYLKKSVDVTEQYVVSDKEISLTEEMLATLDSLLDYCDKEELEVLFVTVPRAEDDENAVPMFHAANKVIEERGYKTLYLTESLDEMHLDMTTDYYNFRHTNIHGSIKYTRYLSEYLIENYGFEDKRENKQYSSWNKGWKKYENIIDAWTLDFELDGTSRDYTLLRPANLVATYEDELVSLSWEESVGAQRYVVYVKKGSNGTWKVLGESESTTYVHPNAEADTKYYYRVVPCYDKDGKTYYGEFDYNGVDVQVD